MSTTADPPPAPWDCTDAVAAAPGPSSHRLETLDGGAERTMAPPPGSSDARKTGAGALGVLLVGCWMGLVFGLSEAGYFAFERFVLGGVPPAGTRLFWMCPVMQTVTFLMLAAPLALVAAGTRKPVSPAPLVCCLAFVGATGFAFLISGIHPAARLLAAGGMAVQAWRYANARGANILQISRRTIVGLLLAVLAIMLVVEGARWISTRRGLAILPPPEDRAPHVLLIVLDTVSAEAVSLGGAEASCGSSADTPNLRAFAEEGALFTRAVAPAPWTLPSHASIFTGRHPHELSCRWFAALDDTYPTIAERLKEAGYLTAGFVANTRFCRAETGLARGFIHYDDYTIAPAQFLLSTELGRRAVDVRWICPDADQVARKSADDVVQAFLGWLDRSVSDNAGRPFFAFLNFFDAHDPYVPPPAFVTAPCNTDARKELIRDWWYINKLELNDEEIEFARTNYHDCIAYLDDRLGGLFRQLRQRGLFDDTLIIVTSDHGEHFGDHELFGHGNSLYQPAIHVPLVLRYPGRVPSGVRCSHVVGLRELPATVLALAGIKRGGDGRHCKTGNVSPLFPGKSLSRFWEGTEGSAHEPATCVISSIATPPQFPPCHGRSPVFRGAMKSVIAEEFKYIRAGEDEELYNIRQDPCELRNLAGRKNLQTKMNWFRGMFADGLP